MTLFIAERLSIKTLLQTVETPLQAVETRFKVAHTSFKNRHSSLKAGHSSFKAGHSSLEVREPLIDGRKAYFEAREPLLKLKLGLQPQFADCGLHQFSGVIEVFLGRCVLRPIHCMGDSLRPIFGHADLNQRIGDLARGCHHDLTSGIEGNADRLRLCAS